MGKKNNIEYCIGTSGWNYAGWRTIFYPEALPKKRWLEYYASQFNTLEINATFYRYFKAETFVNWKIAVPDHFHFIIKVHRLITHRKYLHETDSLIKDFHKKVVLLGEKLSLILLQLPPRMPYDLNRLEQALKAFPRSHPIAVEFRNQKWLTRETLQLLQHHQAVFCNSESPTSKLLDWVTTDIGYIRLHGKTKWYDYNYTKKDLLTLIDHCEKMQAHGAKKIFVLFDNDVAGRAPCNALRLKDLLTKS